MLDESMTVIVLNLCTHKYEMLYTFLTCKFKAVIVLNLCIHEFQRLCKFRIFESLTANFLILRLCKTSTLSNASRKIDLSGRHM